MAVETTDDTAEPGGAETNTMAKKTPAFLVAALALLAGLHQASAQGPEGEQTEPFLYSQDFESGTDPVVFWTSSKKKCTVSFKGVTDERAHSGKRSFKLDVTLDETARFLWRIPLARKVPAAGKLQFSGYMLLGEGTTAEATLGVSYGLPPTRHTGCTWWGPLLRSTDGRWKMLGNDLVQQGKQTTRAVVAFAGSWGVQAENVGAVAEGIILDLRGEAGQRVVLYVDDLEIRGSVPSDAAYRDEIKRRWAPVTTVVGPKVAAWEAALREVEERLASLTNLSPQAEGMRRETIGKIRDVKAKIADMQKADMKKEGIRKADPREIESFLGQMENVSVNIKAVSRAEREGRRALVYVVSPISPVMILPHGRYVPGTPSSEISVVAARGEYEPASFVVSAMSDIHSLSVAVSDLRSGSRTIPGVRVDVKAVKCWYQAGTAWVGNRQDKSKRILTPELLLNDDTLVRVDEEKEENYAKLSFPDGQKYVWISDPKEVSFYRRLPVDTFPVKDAPVLLPLDIPAGQNKQFWLTVNVPTDAEPGTYSGTISLRTPDAALGDLTLNVRVLPFDLLPPYYTSSMDYHGNLDPSGKGAIGSDLKSRKQFRGELKNMVAHGLRNCQHYGIHKKMLGEVLKIREEVGMDNRTLYLKNTIPIGRATAPAALEAIKKNVRDILAFTRAYGTEVVYFYGTDELSGEELTWQRAAWQAVREAGGKIFVAGGGDNIEMMGDIQDMHVRSGWPNKDEVARWHAFGHKIFCYDNPQTGVENPLVYRRNFGLVLWKYGYDGASTNAYQHTFGATWNDFDNPTYRSHTIAYPTVDGVIDTIAWEGYREAVDDVRYVTTLQKAIEAARKSKDGTLARSIETAETFLRRLKTEQDIETGNLDSIRREIIAHILTLTRAPTPAAGK